MAKPGVMNNRVEFTRINILRKDANIVVRDGDDFTVAYAPIYITTAYMM